MTRRPLVILAFALLVTARVLAHPVVENGVEIVVARDHVDVKAKIALVEVDIAHSVGVERGPVDPAKLKSAIDEHAGYLLSHLHLTADGKPIDGTVKKITPPAGEVKWEDFEENFATYELSYPLTTPPGKVRIEEDLLKEFSRLGQAWQAMFVAQTRVEPSSEWTQALLAPDQPLEIACHWEAQNGSAKEVSLLGRGRIDIITGLLLVVALAVGAGWLCRRIARAITAS